MKILAISGSGRASSTNTAMLRAMAEIARPNHQVTVFAGVANLPVFSPDLEAAPLPNNVQSLMDMISESEGIIIASPEYVRAIPGGLKNAIDWLVSREEIIRKPIALLHASHRGNDMLDQLRLVLSTVSESFSQHVFLSFKLMNLSPDEISDQLAEPSNRVAITKFLDDFAKHCG